jgi:hypothetical protein
MDLYRMMTKTCLNFEQLLDNIDNPLKIVICGYLCASWSQSLILKESIVLFQTFFINKNIHQSKTISASTKTSTKYT